MGRQPGAAIAPGRGQACSTASACRTRALADWLAEDLPAAGLPTGATVVASIWGFTRRGLPAAAAAARAAATSPAGRRRGRAWWPWKPTSPAPTSRTAGGCSPTATKGCARPSAAAAGGLAGALPLWAKLSPNVTDLPGPGRRRGGGRRRRAHPDQHGHGPGHRPRDRPAPPGRRRGRTVRTGHPSGRGAGRLRVPGRPPRASRSSASAA